MRLLLTVFLFTFTGLQVAMATECKTPRLSGPPLWSPFISSDQNNQLTGMAFDFMLNFLSNEGLKGQVDAAKPWPRVLADLENGSIDAVVAILKTKEREAKYLYAESWTNDRYGVVVRHDKVFPYSSVDDLKPRSGAYYRGVTFPEPYHTYVGEKHNLTPVSDVGSLIKMLDQERIDYLLVAIDSFFALLPKEFEKGHFQELEPSVVPVPVYIAFSKKSPCKDLIPQLNAFIQKKAIATD